MRPMRQNHSSVVHKETDSGEINALLGMFLICLISKSPKKPLDHYFLRQWQEELFFVHPCPKKDVVYL